MFTLVYTLVTCSVLSQNYCCIKKSRTRVYYYGTYFERKNNILIIIMQMKQLHNTKKINESWSLSLCGHVFSSQHNKFAFNSTNFSNIWSLARLHFAVRTSPGSCNAEQSFYWSRWRDWNKEYYITNQFV